MYHPSDSESEKASNSYLMSLLAILVGLPLPIINLIATFIFFLGNRKSSYYVRWHCTQALLSQASLLLMNSYAFSWTIQLFLFDATLSDAYIAYIITAAIFNGAELIATMYAAIQTRKGHHVSWWFYGSLTQKICKP